MSTIQEMFFSIFWNLQRHERICNCVETGKKTDITKCMKTFSSYHSRISYIHLVQQVIIYYQRTLCSQHFASSSDLVNHQERMGMCKVEACGCGVSQQNTPSSLFSSDKSNSGTKQNGVQTRTCKQTFQLYADLYIHRMIDHMQLNGNVAYFQPLQWQNDEQLP